MEDVTSLAVPARSAGTWYRRWFLLLLILIYASSFVDRIIVAVVGQAIKIEMNLSDLQVGLLGGLAFSIFYTTLGIPIARLADRFNRVTLISLSIIAWSAMTALCGTAGVYWQLLLFRLGVGVGEAGSTPTSHSLISDQFPPQRRATALAIYALGPPIGVIAGALGGGWIVQHLGWRPVFFVVGLPGLVLGCLAYLTLREPKRGATDEVRSASTGVPPLKSVIGVLAGSPLFVQMLLGTVIGAFAQYGINLFIPIYLTRVFGMGFAQAGLVFGLIVGVGGIIGNALGGYSADWASSRDRRWYAWVPALGTFIGFPLMVLAFLMPFSWPVVTALLFAATLLLNMWNGPTFAIVHGLVEPRMRATASAFVFLLMNLIGQGFGPAAIGFLSDRFANLLFAGEGGYRQMCVGTGGLHAAGHHPLSAACQAASAGGVRYAMLAVTIALLWSSLHYFRAARHIERR